MTTLKQGKTPRRLTENVYRGRQLAVELHPGYMKIWPFGSTHSCYTLSYEAAYDLAIKLHVRDLAAAQGKPSI